MCMHMPIFWLDQVSVQKNTYSMYVKHMPTGSCCTLQLHITAVYGKQLNPERETHGLDEFNSSEVAIKLEKHFQNMIIMMIN